MRAYLLCGLLVGLLVPGVALAQAQLTSSYDGRVDSETHREAQLIRCDNSTSIADTNPASDTPIGGETCVSGDWSKPLDCRGQKNLSVFYFEYGAGSADAKIWDCLSIPGTTVTAPSTLGGTIPGTEAPGGTPSAADPDPLCVSLDDAASITIDGNNPGIQLFRLDNQDFHFIVGEINTCTGNCDSTLVASCGR